MSEEIKYEPVFGSQELFHETMSDVICVSKNDETGEVFQYTSIVIALRDLVRYQGDSDFTVAMRRIIKTPVAPVWTKKDKESETLPLVGSFIVGESSGVIYEVIKVTKSGVVIFADTPDDIVGYYDKRDILLFFKPIETPEERAQRLRSEWVEKAYDDLLANVGTHSAESPEFIKQNLYRVYDALLSGELQAPTKGEQS